MIDWMNQSNRLIHVVARSRLAVAALRHRSGGRRPSCRMIAEGLMRPLAR